jgi:hypothetical protein
MTTSKLRVIAGAALIVAGCAGHDDNEITATTTAALEPSPATPFAPTDTYAVLERCAVQGEQTCVGGYWIREVNRVDGLRLVSALDVSRLGTEALAQASGGGNELVVRGAFGPADRRTGLHPFLVYEAWRGLPDVGPILGDGYFTVNKDGDELFASLVNTGWEKRIGTVSVAFAPRLVDTAWLSSRVLEHGALVAGRVEGSAFEALRLDANQVYVRLPDTVGPCPMEELFCGDETATYERDENRCLVPTGCATPRACPMYIPVCDPGYVLRSWASQPAACPAYACDPAFLSL